jgi:hypothetical protein
MGQFLSNLLGVLFGLYGLVGSAFGGLMLVSYPWGLAAHVHCVSGLVSFLILSLTSMFIAFFGALLRAFLWLPSLVYWWVSGPEPSFLHWLMPGLYISCGGTS